MTADNPEPCDSVEQSPRISQSIEYRIFLLRVGSGLFLFVVCLAIISLSIEWYYASEEIPLPASDDLVSVTASMQADHVMFYEDIPETELPRDIAIRVIDYLRPIETIHLNEYDKQNISKSPFIKFRITTRQSQATELKGYICLGHQALVCNVNGRDCVRGGECHYIGYLHTVGGSSEVIRLGECGEGLILKRLVEMIYLSSQDHKDRSEDIEYAFLELDTSSGRRPIEELDRVRDDRENRKSE